MSRQDLEIVREAFLAVGGGDPMAAADFYDPAIEWDMSGVTGWLEKRVYRGPEVIPFLQAWADSWQDWHFDLDEVRDGEGERVGGFNRCSQRFAVEGIVDARRAPRRACASGASCVAYC